MISNYFQAFWLDLVALAVATSLFTAAITGEFYSIGRGGRRTPIASVKSVAPRAAFLLVSFALFVWVVKDFLQKVGH